MKLPRINPWGLLSLAILPASGTIGVLLVVGLVHLVVRCSA